MENWTLKRTSWILAAGVALLLSTIILTPISSQAQNNYWIGPPVGDWKYVWNWSQGEVPVDGEDVYILNGSAVTLNMAEPTYSVPLTGSLNSLQIENGSSLYHTANWTMNIGGGIPAPNDNSELMGLILGYDAGSTGIYYLSGGSNGNLNVSNVTVVGYDGTGIFHNSGTHTTGSLYLGFNNGYGEYNLYSGGTLNVNGWAGLVIGGKNYNPGAGYGVFNQYGGTANIDHLWLADSTSSNNGTTGIYNLMDGALNVSGFDVIGMGMNGTGTFNQYGGTHTVYSDLHVGGLWGGFGSGTGTYNLLSGNLTVHGSTAIGDGGVGTFNQGYRPDTGEWGDGGIHQVYGNLAVGASSAGTYNLIYGSLQTGSTIVGDSGQGTFNQGYDPVSGASGNGGTHTVNGDLIVGNSNDGFYNLYNGQLNVTGNSIIGAGDYGEFYQYGGTHNVGIDLILARDSGSYGYYELDAGNLNVTGNSIIGAGGNGWFYQYGGTHTVGGDLVLAQYSGSYGYYELGWGSNLNVTGSSIIGAGGSGEFYHYGGTHTVGGNLVLGRDSGSYGYYELWTGSNLNVTGNSIIGAGGEGEFDQYGGSHTVGGNLVLGNESTGNGTYNLQGGTLTSGYTNVGAQGLGTFNQTGGTHTTQALTVGDVPNGNGTYTLSGSSSILSVAGDETIGNSGTGTFTQSGGSNTAARINLGGFLGNGTYNLSYGTLNAGFENIGDYGSGTFSQTGGTNTVTNNLNLGGGQPLVLTGTGTYNLKGGVLTVGTLNSGGYINTQVGLYGTGTFNQSGGTHEVFGTLYVGKYPGSNGTYNMNENDGPATLTVHTNTIVGYAGTGTFNQTAGTHTITGNLILGGQFVNPTYYPPDTYFGTGTYNLSGTGALNTNSTIVGDQGTGTFNQNGGTHTTNALTIGSKGTYNMNAGTLNVANIFNNGGFINAGGTVGGIGGNPLTITNYGTISGSGTFNGNVSNYGTVSPGSSPGKLTIIGGYTQGPSGILDIDLGGLVPGAGYDVLDITGAATLGGKLDVDLYGGFIPNPGDKFTFLVASSGVSLTFGSSDLPYGSSYWDIIYGTNSVTLEYLGGEPVPEPSTVFLLLSGLLGLGAFGRRLRRGVSLLS